MKIPEKKRSADLPNPGQRSSSRQVTRIIWLVIAVLASIVSFFLAWPYWRDFSYWAESRTMWAIYFTVGFVLAVYVFYVFFGVLRTLFEHDEIERAELAVQSEADNTEGQP